MRISNFVVVGFCFTITSLSCTNSLVVEKELNNCITDSIRQHVQSDLEPFDEIIIDLENVLKQRGNLHGNSKSDYINFTNAVFENEDKALYNLFDSVLTQHNYSLIDNNLYIFMQCYPYVLVTQKHEMNSSFFYQHEIINAILAQGYNDKDLVMELIEATSDQDFQKIIYRAPVLLVLANKLNNVHSPW